MAEEQRLDASTFAASVTANPGTVLVLFTDRDYNSSEIEDIFSQLNARYNQEAEYYRYVEEDIAQLKAYGVNRLPTIGLYSQGYLIDQISGNPSSYEQLVDMRKDVAVWMNRTVLPLGKQTRSNVVYRFNNTNRIAISLY